MGLAYVTGNGVWDAVASVAIGLLLMVIGLAVNGETRSLLVGESATPDMEAQIRLVIEATDGIAGLVDLRTIHLGPDDLVIAGRIVVDRRADADAIDRAIAAAEARIVADIGVRRVTVYLEARIDRP